MATDSSGSEPPAYESDTRRAPPLIRPTYKKQPEQVQFGHVRSQQRRRAQLKTRGLQKSVSRTGFKVGKCRPVSADVDDIWVCWHGASWSSCVWGLIGRQRKRRAGVLEQHLRKVIGTRGFGRVVETCALPQTFIERFFRLCVFILIILSFYFIHLTVAPSLCNVSWTIFGHC